MDNSLSNRIAVFRSGCVRISQQLEYETNTIARLQDKIKQIEEDKAQLVKAVGLIDRCIQAVSANGIGKIESIVSAGLRQVFGDPTMGFVVEKKDGAKGSSYRLLVQHGDTVGNPMTSFGGGVQNIAAFLLRVILIKRFKLAKLMMLDESFSNLGNGSEPPIYLKRASAMLRTLCDDHGFTIFAITHQPLLANAADRVYRVSGKPPDLIRVDGEELLNLKLLSNETD